MSRLVRNVLITIFLLQSCLQSYPASYGAQREVRSPSLTALSRRSGTHPRDYYLGLFNPSCASPSSESSDQWNESFSSADGGAACLSGNGVQVTIIDTGLCSHISEWSRNEITCTSLVPSVGCGDDSCEHGTRSVSVLAGHLISPDTLQEWNDSTATASRSAPPSTSPAWYASQTTSFSNRHFIGMAPRASVRVLRVADQHGRMRERYFAAAVELLLDEAEAYRRAQLLCAAEKDKCALPSLRRPADIVSFSCGSGDYFGAVGLQARLHRLMRDYGVIVIASAGNDEYRFGGVSSPADMPGVIAVGAVKRARHPTPPSPSVKHSSPRDDEDEAFQVTQSVAGFSGRGPTTWELPFGAARVKPDLLALGQDVWTVEGVKGAATRTNQKRKSAAVFSRLSRRRQRLQLQLISGTSVAAPTVAGVAALLLEGVRRQAAMSDLHTNASCVDGKSRNCSGAAYWMDRLHASLRVRQLLLSTAEPLRPPSFTERVRSSELVFDNMTSNSSSNNSTPSVSERDASFRRNTSAIPRRVLAGLPLTHLYTRYLRLTRWSVMAQGMGEVQPRRAVARLFSPHTGSKVACTSWSVPASMLVGGRAENGACRINRDDSAEPPSFRVPEAASPQFWWPYSDMAVYPGAATLLLNFSVHLCPLQSCVDQYLNGLRAKSFENNHNGSPFAPAFVFTKVFAEPVCGADAHPLNRTRVRSVVLLKTPETTTRRHASPQHNAVRRVLHRHLLRVALALHPIAEQSQVVPSRSQQYTSEAQLPQTAFALSAALHVPLEAHTQLRYCADASDLPVVAGRVKITTSEGSNAAASGTNRSAVARRTSRSTDRVCVPLFHAFSTITVEGEVRVLSSSSARNKSMLFSLAQHQLEWQNTSKLLSIPVTIHITAPPPRAQRVLIDTSLDWLNPTTAASDLFIPGNDPSVPAYEDMYNRLVNTAGGRGYAEFGGGHPHTNLALLYVYLRHSLGLAVSFFPLLHVATSPGLSDVSGSSPLGCASDKNTDESSGGGGGVPFPGRAAKAAAVTTLSSVGAVLVVDPKRPLTPPMRAVLTEVMTASPEAEDPPHLVLISDWYSAEVAAALRWGRDDGVAQTLEDGVWNNTTEHFDSENKTNETTSDNGATDATGRNGVRLLRAWRTVLVPNANKSSVESTSPAQRAIRGLQGTCHVPSWNRWLDELAAAVLLRKQDYLNTSTTSTSEGKQGSCTAPSFPFHLSESEVVSVPLIVSAGQRSLNDETGQDSHRVERYRTLGKLEGAGVLQWSLTEPRPSEEDNVHCSSFREFTEGKATLCSVRPEFAFTLARLRKRISPAPGSVAGLPSDVGVEEDVWEQLDPRATWPSSLTGVRVIKGVAKSKSEDSVGNLTSTTPRATKSAGLPRGFWGFVELPTENASSSSTPARHPGRIAIFTDSNCFSIGSRDVQDTLSKLDRVLPAYKTDLEFINSAAGQTLVHAESGSASTCVEMLKELLFWTHTGDIATWAKEMQLPCEMRTWHSTTTPAKARRSSELLTVSNNCEEKKNETSCCGNKGQYTQRISKDSREEGEADENLDVELLRTAPERESVGRLVTQLWAATVLASEADKHFSQTDDECNLTLLPVCIDACSLPATKDAGVVVGIHATTASQELAKQFEQRQSEKAAEVLTALSTRYHGDWDTPPNVSETGDSLQGLRRDVKSRSSADLMGSRGTSRFHVPSPLRDFGDFFYWLSHPIVVFQLVAFIALVVGYIAYEASKKRKLSNFKLD